jgi:dihydroorotate dehydrogenase electron transfer subunit
MNNLKHTKCEITFNRQIAPNIFDMRFVAPFVAETAVPGQFVMLYLDDKSRLLPRPFGICDVNRDTGETRIVYGVVGEGTAALARFAQGAVISVTGPLGNGFKIAESDHVIVGGGTGIPPLLFLCWELVAKNAANIDVFLGYRTAFGRPRNGNGCGAPCQGNGCGAPCQGNGCGAPCPRRIDAAFLAGEFSAMGVNVNIATDDGSLGFQGDAVSLVSAAFGKNPPKPGVHIYACGPKPMLKSLSAFAATNNFDCQVSMEERMACGLGACVGCAVKIKNSNGWAYKKVCSDGPVFGAGEVFWDE